MAPDHTPEPDMLDDLLASSAPRTSTLTPELEHELVAMSVDAEYEARPAGRLRRMPRAAVVGIAAVLVLGGAGAAAAATLSDWAPWATTPDASFTFTLPSGAVCEQRYGNVKGTDEVTQAIREYMKQVDVLQLADIDAELQRARADENVQVNADGSQEPGGYGTPYYNADSEYLQAVMQATSKVITTELDRQGIDYEGSSWEGEAHCPGAQW